MATNRSTALIALLCFVTVVVAAGPEDYQEDHPWMDGNDGATYHTADPTAMDPVKIEHPYEPGEDVPDAAEAAKPVESDEESDDRSVDERRTPEETEALQAVHRSMADIENRQMNDNAAALEIIHGRLNRLREIVRIVKTASGATEDTPIAEARDLCGANQGHHDEHPKTTVDLRRFHDEHVAHHQSESSTPLDIAHSEVAYMTATWRHEHHTHEGEALKTMVAECAAFEAALTALGKKGTQ
jgi:hypothetical protein